ncbi:nucleotidyltransferase domain-containing protein [Candidatus Bathyarchaeota archaeon]|nr:nucleotidyltransferase domain-containing protein [Candidatus Bathyarchaeota archaeon]
MPRLRDRDAIVTREGIILRVLGCDHPSKAYFCDPEYAPATLFRSDDPRALRNGGDTVYYKFYGDEGWEFIRKERREYLIPSEMLQQKIIGVERRDISEIRKPEVRLEELVEARPRDELHSAMQEALDFTCAHADVSVKNFGVFGSLLHGFYDPRFSDIDLILYGSRNAARLRESLDQLYENGSSPFLNEFMTDEAVKGKTWRFKNYSPKEYVQHQRRKLIYALYKDQESGRTIKTEFEPVKEWDEITNEHNTKTRVEQMGWTKLVARVNDDGDAPFIPSRYRVEPLKVLEGAREVLEVSRIVSYLEEFRMQASTDEVIYVEGNLEKVVTPRNSFYQIVLTYCPRYYEQVLKSTNSSRLF